MTENDNINTDTVLTLSSVVKYIAHVDRFKKTLVLHSTKYQSDN